MALVVYNLVHLLPFIEMAMYHRFILAWTTAFLNKTDAVVSLWQRILLNSSRVTMTRLVGELQNLANSLWPLVVIVVLAKWEKYNWWSWTNLKQLNFVLLLLLPLQQPLESSQAASFVHCRGKLFSSFYHSNFSLHIKAEVAKSLIPWKLARKFGTMVTSGQCK